MCGIVAVRRAAGGLRVGALDAAMAQLRPRGPDGEGTWGSPTGRAVLGHTRLAIVDRAGGAQPITTVDERQVVVGNGEIYDHGTLRRQLAAGGVRFRTGSDTETALHLYRRDGPAALARLHGEFAFVVWDEATGVLFAARDRFGVKPLYYAEHAGRLVLASSIGALLATGVPAAWDVASFADHLQLAVPTDRTLFDGVRQLPPGCWLTADDDGVRITPYWSLDFAPAADLAGDPTDRSGRGRRAHAEEFAAALTAAVEARSVAEVPVACHLSGGLDSSAVLAVAPRSASGRAFTVGFDDPDFDETDVAARTAERQGIAHQIIPFRAADYLAHVEGTVRAGEMVLENAHGVARFRQSAAIRAAGFPVALSGDGGDEVLAGYPQMQRDLELTTFPERMARAAQGYRRITALGTAPHLTAFLETLGFLPSWVVERHLQVTMPVAGLLTAEFRRLLTTRDAATPLLRGAAPTLEGCTGLHQSMTLFGRSWFPGYILLTERLDAAQAVETRLPFLDHRVVDVLRRTPPAWYTVDGRTKAPLCDSSVGARLTTEVLGGTKRGFLAPPLLGRRSALAELRERVDGAVLEGSPFFDRRAVLRLLDGERPAHTTDERLLALVLSTVVLAEQFALQGSDGHA